MAFNDITESDSKPSASENIAFPELQLDTFTPIPTRAERNPFSSDAQPNRLLPPEFTAFKADFGKADSAKGESEKGDSGKPTADSGKLEAGKVESAKVEPNEAAATADSGKGKEAHPAKSEAVLKTDKDGYVTDIEYPGGTKSRHIERDPNSHEVLSVTTKTPDALTTLKQKDGKWSLSMQSLELPVNGKIEVSKNGEVATQVGEAGTWKVDRLDGSTIEEKQSADGSRLRLGTDGKAERLVRADKSVVERVSENKIVESRPGQKDVTWTKEGDSWKSDSEAAARKNLKFSEDGKLSFTDKSGVKHEINSRGEESLEGNGPAKITADSLNRPSVVDLPEKTRKYEYFDDKSNDIKSVTIINKKDNSSSTFTRDSKDSHSWAGTTWRGDIKVGPDGVHSTRPDNGSVPGPDSRWDSAHPDGKVTSDIIGADGSRVSYDKSNNSVVSVRTADGVRAERVNQDGKESVRYYNPRVGDSTTWSKDVDGSFKSDSEANKESRKDLSITPAGDLSFKNEKNQTVVEHKDGSRSINSADGTVMKYGADKQLQSLKRGNTERVFVQGPSGLSQVVDRDLSNKQEKTVFDAKDAEANKWNYVHLSESGDLSYQKSDGGAVIERANGLKVELDKDGDMTSVSSSKENRSFKYLGEGDKKTLVSITEGAKDQQKTFTRVINPDGSFVNEFRGDKGQASRFDVVPCKDGDYEFTQKAGDKKVYSSLIAR